MEGHGWSSQPIGPKHSSCSSPITTAQIPDTSSAQRRDGGGLLQRAANDTLAQRAQAGCITSPSALLRRAHLSTPLGFIQNDLRKDPTVSPLLLDRIPLPLQHLHARRLWQAGQQQGTLRLELRNALGLLVVGGG